MNWAFPIRVDSRTGKLRTVSGEEEIRQSLLLLLKTIRGERQLQPLYGSRLTRFAFEPVSYELFREIEEEVLSTIHYWEKRVEEVQADILQSTEDETRLLIRITYRIKESGIQDSLDYHYRLAV